MTSHQSWTCLAALSLIATLCACSEAATDYDGVYVWTESVETFTPCRTQSTWMITAQPASSRLATTYRELAPAPFEGIFVQLTGRYAGSGIEEKGEAFGEQYDGIFEITEVRSIQKMIPPGCEVTTAP